MDKVQFITGYFAQHTRKMNYRKAVKDTSLLQVDSNAQVFECAGCGCRFCDNQETAYLGSSQDPENIGEPLFVCADCQRIIDAEETRLEIVSFLVKLARGEDLGRPKAYSEWIKSHSQALLIKLNALEGGTK